MLFSSFEYMLLFLPVVLVGAFLLRRLLGAKASQLWVLAASLLFYSWWKLSNLPYLAGSILVNWGLVRVMDKAEQPARKRFMLLGLVLNVGYLCLFKYINFFLSNIRFLLPSGFHFPDLNFPLGISFFTLLQIMYLIDAYEGLLPAMNLFDYATFVSFFPYVISGPIAKSKRMLHQFGDFGGKEGHTGELVARGLFLFAIGLSKKVLFADVFAVVANAGFNTSAHLTALEGWSFSIAYALQMYFDFSGYSDMAIGSALMLGIEIPRNFDAPLRAKSLIEFWQRWHISLSQFITTYLYTPMLKSLWKISLFTSALATLFAMTVAGLWHGPAWTFVVYGVIHGFGLACNQYWRKKKMPKLPAFVSWMLTFVIVDIALLFFRASSLRAAGHLLLAMFDPRQALGATTLREALATLTITSKLVLLPLGLVTAFFWKSSDELSREFKPTFGTAIAVSAAFVSSMLFLVFNTSQDFLYFKF